MMNPTHLGGGPLLRLVHVLAVVAIVTTAPRARAQSARVVQSTPSCAECRIELVHVAELGNEYGDAGAQGSLTAIARTSRGEYLAVYSEQAFEIVVHGPDGRVIRKFGRRGDGPGEFQRISLIRVSGGDTIHVLDRSRRRYSVFASDGRFVRSSPFPWPTESAVVFPGGSLAIGATVVTPERAGLPLHGVRIPPGKDAEIVASFGADTALSRLDLLHLLLRRVSRDSDSTFWAAPVNEYRVERWTLSGRRLDHLIRNASWFPTWLHTANIDDRTPPQPLVTSLSPEGQGRLWTVVRVPDSQWRSGISPRIGETGHRIFRVTNPSRVTDSVIELLDPRLGRVVASHRFDEAIGSFIDDDLVVVYLTDGSSSRIHVRRVRLVEPSSAR